MSGSTLADFLAYWGVEGASYARHGDYEWMAAQTPGQKVLEIGCGLGFGTAALLARGMSVMAIDTLPECLRATQNRVGLSSLTLLEADVAQLSAEQRALIEVFAPETVVCWLMGAPAERTGAQLSDGGSAVVAYREKIHRTVAELAVSLPSIRFLHLVDRTAIPWQAKDIGRDTLVRYHQTKTLLDLPLTAERSRALYRKLAEGVSGMRPMRQSNPGMKGVVPTLASLLVERKN